MNFEMFEEVVHNFGFMSNLIKKSWTDTNDEPAYMMSWCMI